MPTNATIEQDINQIRTAIYGRDVREAIADGIEHCYGDNTAAIGNATIVISNANAAADAANSAASRVEEGLSQISTAVNAVAQAQTQAEEAATDASAAAEDAVTAINLTRDATTNANAAADKINNMTVDSEILSPGSSVTTTISEVSGHKHIHFGLPKGDKGDPFTVKKTFASVAEMNAYSGSDVVEGDFVMITSNVEDPDNAKLYLKASSGYTFVTDLSGTQGMKGDQGIQGETGNGIALTTLNADYTLTITFTDGTTYTTPNPIRGEQGIQGVQGIQGETGNGIASTELNADYTLTITFTDGTTYNTPNSIRGPQGIQGETGNGIALTTLNADYTLTITFTDGTTYTTPNPIRGEQGIQGVQGIQGETGNGIASTELNADYTLTITFTDGTTYTTPNSIRGPKGETGSVENVYATSVPMSESDSTTIFSAMSGKIDSSEKGVSDGIASLDSTGKVPASQLPSIGNITYDMTLSELMGLGA